MNGFNDPDEPEYIAQGQKDELCRRMRWRGRWPYNFNPHVVFLYRTALLV